MGSRSAQRRLAISRLRVPNLDGIVLAAAGNLFSIGAPRHRVDPEIVRRQDTNQQKQRAENLIEKKIEKTTYKPECPVMDMGVWEGRDTLAKGRCNAVGRVQ